MRRTADFENEEFEEEEEDIALDLLEKEEGKERDELEVESGDEALVRRYLGGEGI